MEAIHRHFGRLTFNGKVQTSCGKARPAVGTKKKKVVEVAAAAGKERKAGKVVEVAVEAGERKQAVATSSLLFGSKKKRKATRLCASVVSRRHGWEAGARTRRTASIY